MAKRKLQKFAEIGQMPNVIQNFNWENPVLINHQQTEVKLKGKWASAFFNNQQPIVLELACGYGEYAVALGKLQPQLNFIGIDIKGNRIHHGAKLALQQGLGNVGFLRTGISLLPHFFAQNEISEIWIPFPDPYLPNSQARKRLTSPQFLQLYRQFLQPQGRLHLKTDSEPLYQYTLETLEQTSGAAIIAHTNNLYQHVLYQQFPALQIPTRYESLRPSGADTIKYICFTIN
ncbi:MAG: tRNA (guanosine(46)-N7)-methyltransferase TrmB [Sphingobacteriales bacterium]|jgi:tRNA (guanine-N7-)-methyltransferase|nr:tRNA (guanosine(46)-N7)-methyltransferase TrmB [Sphingobacteriales bacterium]MBP9142018.1 tRNA (guanosine(46)-N7)-methyltransferase TrmB [Chitinophagales bacterium]MDA0197792.1 tRNA (guanosine(46)-N7)-methyltransferase TrmB [Bacteroidota bacterium]MBK6888881.1 tRNA (guanosine(46)-N7)-methyltransferase TrmB [Sphingobacteriales bacterium]MBK7528615.1 tRNA (guanosine(46)-N7)-methyltransferase TrmB [Sphingobacteriales bacterium]